MPAQRDSRPRPVLTGRALVLGAVVVLLVVVLASPIQRYLASRSDTGSAADQLQQDRAALRSLTTQQQLYGNPGYIQQQARARLQYAMPGDTVYIVDRGHGSSISAVAPAKSTGGTTAWNTRLWNSVSAAAR